MKLVKCHLDSDKKGRFEHVPMFVDYMTTSIEMSFREMFEVLRLSPQFRWGLIEQGYRNFVD